MAKLSRIYQGFAGVDFSNEEVAPNRSPDSVNMWKDYQGSLGRCIQTRDDLVLDTAYGTSVFGIYFYKVGVTTYKVVHTGTSLYSNGTLIKSGMNPSKTQFFIFNNILYIKDGLNYLSYNGTTCANIIPYIPTTKIGNKPMGGGITNEDNNMLTGERINTFLADGISTEYHLETTNLDNSYTEIVKVNSLVLTKGTDFTVDVTTGVVIFTTAPGVPLTDGQDNVSIQFRKTISGYADRINKCTLATVFDNRVFFAGNQDYPNVLFHCSVNNPGYCSDLDFYNEGTELNPIRALIPAENAIWVAKAPGQSNGSLYYHQPTIDSTYGKIYPSQHSTVSVGCVGSGINFNDDVVFFSENGMEGITGNIGSEHITSHRSTLVDSKLLTEASYANMILEEFQGYLLVIIGSKVYLADSRQMSQIEGHYEYEWYYWELSKTIISSRVYDGILYLGASDGIYTLTATPTSLNSYWTTPKDNFGSTNLRKTTDKRGGIIDMSGAEITLHTKIDNGSFKFINTYINTKEYVVFKAKEKKFKTLQLKLSSTKPFKLYDLSLEVYMGSYIKR